MRKALKLFFQFLYHFMFIDQSSGMVSQTKFFSIIGYALWCWLFPYAVINGSGASMDLWLVFGIVVIGNRTLNVWMQTRAGQPSDPEHTWKNVVKPNVPKTDDLV